MKTLELVDVKVITVSELVTILSLIDKAVFCHVETETVPNMVKTNNPFYVQNGTRLSPTGKVVPNMEITLRKHTSHNYYIGAEYSKRVDSNMEKEGLEPNFVVEKPSGKHHVSKTVLQSDTDENVYYVELEYFKETVPTVVYSENGVVLTDEIQLQTVKDLLVKSFDSTKQEQERKVYVITPKLSNIKKLTLNGQKYEIQ